MTSIMIAKGLAVPPRKMIPKEMIAQAREPYLETAKAYLGEWRSELGRLSVKRSVWMGACYAWPHVDPDWEGQLFLTLTVIGSHIVSDEKAEDGGASATPGALCVIDPMVRHWLQPENAYRSTKVEPWLALQWEVPRRYAKRAAREIVAALNGEWVDRGKIDKRYRSWAPEVAA